MNVTTLSVLMVAALAGNAAGDLPPPERSYSILILLPVSARSHKTVHVAVAEALVERGHQVVMLTNHPKATTIHPNISEVFHGLSHYNDVGYDMFKVKMGFCDFFDLFTEGLRKTARDLYHVPAVNELYRRRKDFDLIVVDYLYSEVSLPFIYEVPFVTMHTSRMRLEHSALHGNIYSPSFFCEVFDSISLKTAWKRLGNIFTSFSFSFLLKVWKLAPIIQKEISLHFPDLPPLQELEKNQSLMLLNTHVSMGHAVPMLPSQVEVGGIHCRPAKPLPPELESWMAGAGDAGVVYFSLGSLTRGTSLPKRYLDVLLEAFRRLPQRVLWKYEEELEGVPDNVRTGAWLPQQDILGHEQVRVFLCHSGLLSLQEAFYHATPLVVLPIFADQFENARLARDEGLGHLLVWEDLTADAVIAAVTDVANNSRYKENAERVSALLRDRPMTPQELVVFWMEYVIRHRGAPHLRPPVTRQSLIELLLVDLVALVLGALLIFLLVLWYTLKAVSAACWRKAKVD